MKEKLLLQLKPKPALIQFLSKLTLLITTSVNPEMLRPFRHMSGVRSGSGSG